MYNITKLSKPSQDFISQLTLGNRSKALETSIALARVLAYGLAIPSSPVEDVAGFFRSQHKVQLLGVVGLINELTILDLEAVVVCAERFYTLRYQAAFGDCYVMALKKETAIVDFFKISKIFDPVTIQCIEDNSLAITSMVNKFKTIVDELKV